MSADAGKILQDTWGGGELKWSRGLVPFKFTFDALKENGELIQQCVTLSFTGSCSTLCFAKDMNAALIHTNVIPLSACLVLCYTMQY